jgi:hypothetical protein
VHLAVGYPERFLSLGIDSAAELKAADAVAPGPKKGVWNFHALKLQHFIGVESSRHLFSGKAMTTIAQRLQPFGPDGDAISAARRAHLPGEKAVTIGIVTYVT